jgi:membrane protease YdiL (CAAX protease family)
MKKAFPTTLEAVFLVLGLYLAEFVAGAALQDFRTSLDLGPREIDALATVIGNGIVLTVALQLADLDHRRLVHDNRAPAWTTALLLLPLVAALVPALLLLTDLAMQVLTTLAPLSRWEEAFFERMGSGSLPVLVSVCVLAPVCEEMLFRGVILRGFLARYPRWHAIVASSLVFGAAHLNLYQLFVGLVLGVLLGWLYERTRSLVPCIGLHAFYNAAVTWYAWQAANDGRGLDPGAWVLLLAMGGIALWVLRRVLRSPGQAMRPTSAEPSRL